MMKDLTASIYSFEVLIQGNFPVVQTETAIYLFEFKLDNDPTALEQIKNKEYFKKYMLDRREIHLVGVNFDTEKGNLVGWETCLASQLASSPEDNHKETE